MNKVLIISDEFDVSTQNVIQWLYFFGFQVDRFSFLEFVNKFPVVISLQNNLYSVFENYVGVWYRRDNDITKFVDAFNKNNALELQKLMISQLRYLKNKIYSQKNHPNWISSYSNIQLNKFDILDVANDCGFNIPLSVITNSKQEVIKTFAGSDYIIIKSVVDNSMIIDNNKVFSQFAKKITESDLEKLPDFFFPTYFQDFINKEFDLRVFYFFGEIYSMCIFHGNDDFKQNYHEHRYVPYKLPKNIEISLIKLMNKLSLNTASIDIVMDINSNYFFLEVNPVGQFSMVSGPCNFYLERKIALKLIGYE